MLRSLLINLDYIYIYIFLNLLSIFLKQFLSTIIIEGLKLGDLKIKGPKAAKALLVLCLSRRSFPHE